MHIDINLVYNDQYKTIIFIKINKDDLCQCNLYGPAVIDEGNKYFFILKDFKSVEITSIANFIELLFY